MLLNTKQQQQQNRTGIKIQTEKYLFCVITVVYVACMEEF